MNPDEYAAAVEANRRGEQWAHDALARHFWPNHQDVRYTPEDQLFEEPYRWRPEMEES